MSERIGELFNPSRGEKLSKIAAQFCNTLYIESRVSLHDLDRLTIAAGKAEAEAERFYRETIQVGRIFRPGRDLTWDTDAVPAAKTKSWQRWKRDIKSPRGTARLRSPSS